MTAIALVSTAPGDPAAEAPGGVTVTPAPSDFAQDGVAAAEESPEDLAMPEAVACPVPGALEPRVLHPATAAMTRTAAEQADQTEHAVRPVRIPMKRRLQYAAIRLLNGKLLPFRVRVPPNRPMRLAGVIRSRE